MSVRTPLDSARSTRTGVHRAIGVPIALCIVLAVTLVGSLAGADTPTQHTIRASVGAQTNVAPPGPITGLSVVADSPSTITLRVTEGGGQTISGLGRIALCEGGISVSNVADLFPSDTGNCLDQPLQAGTLHFVTNVTKANVADNFIETTVKVGSGTRQVPFDDGGGAQTNTITCDATHDCSLWFTIARTGGTDLAHYDLDYGASGGTTSSTTTSTTAAPSSTTTTTAAPGSTTTTTAAPGSTTTTTAAPGSTTTTTAAPGSTTTTTAAGGSTTSTTFVPAATCGTTASTTSTTVAGSSTTSTTAGSSTTSSTSTTSTTLPSGTTISGSAAAGGTITVSSTGWLPNAKVTGFLCSDPVTLGTLPANASGAITGTFAVPSNVPAGKHTFELGGKGTSGTNRSIKAEVTVTASAGGTTSTTAGTGSTGGGTTGGSTGGSGGGIPTTGSNIGKVLGAAFLILVAGGLFAVSAIQRRGRLSFDR